MFPHPEPLRVGHVVTTNEDDDHALCQCGNDYANPMKIELNGETLAFDSFECAIQHLAPTCGHCGCRIIGHGIETDSGFFCCAHCARHAGEPGAVDNL